MIGSQMIDRTVRVGDLVVSARVALGVLLGLASAAALGPTLLAAEGDSRPHQRLEFRDGDRVVFLGNTLIERAQSYGYWETLLTRRFPNRAVTFRNLGWSGDTVFAESRAGFDTPAEGFQRLTDQILRLQPTVILVGYGNNAAFAGEEGLATFLDGLNRLLAVLEQTEARIVLLSTTGQENLGPPLPDPAAHNRDLATYASALRKVAEERGYGFVDFLSWQSQQTDFDPMPLTDNGLHFTAYGYWKTAGRLEEQLFPTVDPWSLKLRADGEVTQAQGVNVSELKAETRRLRFHGRDEVLPVPIPPNLQGTGMTEPTQGVRTLSVSGLAPGRYALTIDGQPVAAADAAEWAAGVSLVKGPQFDQVQKLREAIIRKNQLYFYRWRPQNITYLFGFRKHEQGNNAKEIPEFDPLVAEQEAKIAQLRVPAVHTFELLPENGRDK